MFLCFTKKVLCIVDLALTHSLNGLPKATFNIYLYRVDVRPIKGRIKEQGIRYVLILLVLEPFAQG